MKTDSWGRKEVHIGFWWTKLTEREEKVEDLTIDGRMVLKWIFKNWDESTDWIYLVHDTDRWRALVNAVMNLRVRGGRV